MNEETIDNIVFFGLILIFVAGITIPIIILTNNSEHLDNKCVELGWEMSAGHCYCQNTTYDVNTGEETIIKHRYNKELGCFIK